MNFIIDIFFNFKIINLKIIFLSFYYNVKFFIFIFHFKFKLSYIELK
jgi:hypothetical protein